MAPLDGLYGEGGLPAPGSGTGRPCFIAHDTDYPETECDGLHGSAATTFHRIEAAAVTEVLLAAARSDLHVKPEEPMPNPPETHPIARRFGRSVGYLIGAIIALTLIAAVAAGAWWLVTTLWGWVA